MASDPTQYPWERVHTFLSDGTGEKDEARELAELLREAEGWIELRRNEWLAKNGRKLIRREARKRAKSKARVGVFEPIHHTPEE